MKRTLTLLILIIVLTAATEALSVDANQTLYVSVTELNVRAGPSKDAEVRTTLARGDQVLTTGEASDGWIRVCLEPIYGWVRLDLLSQEEPYTDVTGTIIADGRVRLRDAPGGERLDWMQPGDQVAVLSIMEREGGHKKLVWAKWHLPG